MSPVSAKRTKEGSKLSRGSGIVAIVVYEVLFRKPRTAIIRSLLMLRGRGAKHARLVSTRERELRAQPTGRRCDRENAAVSVGERPLSPIPQHVNSCQHGKPTPEWFRLRTLIESGAPASSRNVDIARFRPDRLLAPIDTPADDFR